MVGAVSFKKTFLIFISALLADQLTKRWAFSYLVLAPPGGMNGLFTLALHENRGISFSLLSGLPSAGLALAILGIALMVFACARFKTLGRTPGVALLWAGAVGNLADRVFCGYVIDWIYAGVFMNLADIWLCLGGLLLLVQIFRFDDRRV